MKRGGRSLSRQITRLAWRTSTPEERATLLVVFIKAVIAAAAVHRPEQRSLTTTREDLLELERVLAAAETHLDAVHRRQATVLFDDASVAVASRSDH